MRAIYTIAATLVLLVGCSAQTNKVGFKPPANEDEFSNYWYQGEAELTGYKLTQARYGELREGHAVLVFVKEDVSKEHVKVQAEEKGVSCLKLNFTRKFNTGIYPYSTMTTTLTPIDANKHPNTLRSSLTVQEWCGHVYAQLDFFKGKYQLVSHSYFPGEADSEAELGEAILEDELFNRIKINPDGLPEGEQMVIPSMLHSRFKHEELKPEICNITKLADKEGVVSYNILYTEINRKVSITYKTTFPYEILGWTETFVSGFGDDAKEMTTTATKINTIKSAYWTKNHNSDSTLRKELGIE